MGLSERLKSKKVVVGLGAGAILLVFFLFKFMTSGGAEVAPERDRSAPGVRKPASKPPKKEAASSPLFETLKAWKDPFRVEDAQVIELQDKINAVKKEIEFLKITLEEKKLRREIKELESEIGEAGGTATPQLQPGATSAGGKEGSGASARGVLVKAILITDDEKKALIASGSESCWVHEGEEFDGWEIKEINIDNVVLSRAGKNRVFFYNRPSFTQGGKS
ncbi:MAG: hypothetical protein AMJ41_01835 [candidate division Zixibacteria bacterium DG_27]|nr:MAG: hypothetical protein AMJ41_01835 [candidate division Zixibacteria bacterium DG_27]